MFKRSRKRVSEMADGGLIAAQRVWATANKNRQAQSNMTARVDAVVALLQRRVEENHLAEGIAQVWETNRTGGPTE